MPQFTLADFAKAHEDSYSLVHQAHEAELAQHYERARDLQILAIAALKYYIAILKKKTEDRRRAKLQLKHSVERKNVLVKYLKNISEASGSLASVVPAPLPLPSDLTINQELMDPNSAVFLSMVERSIWTSLPGTDPTSDERVFFTPLLSTSLPVTTYHVYHEMETRHSGPAWHFLHIKDFSKSQTHYTMACSAVWHSRLRPTIFCTMFRASNCNEVCARVKFDIKDAESHKLGCEMKIAGPTGTTIYSSPDRDRRGWTPRRFRFGDRRFVWHSPEFSVKRTPESTADPASGPIPYRSSGVLSSFLQMEELYEVIEEWPIPTSKTGKTGDELFDRPLAWGERSFFKFGGHVCTVNLVGGLDQLFREFILVSMLGPIMLGLAFKDESKEQTETTTATD